MSAGVWNEKCIISPSLICLDMCNLESQAKILEQSGIQLLHVVLDHALAGGDAAVARPARLDVAQDVQSALDAVVAGLRRALDEGVGQPFAARIRRHGLNGAAGARNVHERVLMSRRRG